MPGPRTKIAFAVPRYGQAILGGAETHCRVLAEHLKAAGEDVEVLTTCAVDHFTWRNELPPGTDVINEVPVHRFPVSERDNDRWWELHTRIGLGQNLGYAEQLEWMGNSVWSEGMLDAARADYDWVIAIPYLFGTTFWSALERPNGTALISCLHDEPYAHLSAVQDALTAVEGCMVSTAGERQLLAQVAPAARAETVGVGFDDEAPTSEQVATFCHRRGIEPGYLLYAGRREAAKGLPELFDHYGQLCRADPKAPALALMGTGPCEPPQELRNRIIDLGFVPDEERSSAYAAAAVLVHPSRLEALGMVLMEAWLCGTPALVSSGSRVLRAHCQDSGGGLWYENGPEFIEAIETIVADATLSSDLAEAGGRYVRDVYSWDAVQNRFSLALAAWS